MVIKLSSDLRFTKNFKALVVGAKKFACNSRVAKSLFNERARVDRSLLFPVYPRPHRLSTTLDPACEFSLAAAHRDGEQKGLKGDRLSGVFHGHNHKPLFKERQTLVYGEHTQLFIQFAL